MSDRDLDIACTIVRIVQAHEQPHMRGALLDRLVTCDVPRLRALLPIDVLRRVDEALATGGIDPHE